LTDKPKTIGTFDISQTSDPAKNEDWIKTPKNRASEQALHDALEHTHGAQGKPIINDHTH
jgi:hypothetical protein